MKAPVNVLFYFLLLCFVCCSIGPIHAQRKLNRDRDYVIIKMKDGNRIVGKKLAVTEESIVVETEVAGKLNLAFKDIAHIRELNEAPKGDGLYFIENRSYMRGFISPTGYGLEKGEGYYQNYMLFFHQVNYGFTDRFSLGFSTEVLSPIANAGFGDPVGPSYLINPKFSIAAEEGLVNIGIAAVAAGLADTGSPIDLGALYGVVTLGAKDRHLNMGIGFGISESSVSPSPVFSLGGMYRVGNKGAFILESWIFPPEAVTGISLGLRILGNRVNWDILFVGGFADGFFGGIPLPIVGINVPFGNW